jgi:hypothetical protein
MPFIGNQPALSYTSFAKQDFTTSATTSYTLDNPVANENEIALFINFVRQEPTTAYTASGTSLTLTSATSASDDMYCVFLGKAVQTVNPPSGSVGISQLSATGTKDSTTFLRGDNTFASAGGDNTPAFFARMSADQSTTNGAISKVQLDVEDYDTDSCFDNSTNYRFTPTTAGKYFFFAGGRGYANSGTLNYVNILIRKNGTAGIGNTFTNSSTEQYSSLGNSSGVSLGIILNMNGTTDYVELYMQVGGTSPKIGYASNGNSTFFGGYKIIE